MENNENQNYRPDLEDLITLEEAAKISGFTTRHLRKLASSGDIWAKKLGHNWFTTAKSVEGYLVRERKPGPKPKKST